MKDLLPLVRSASEQYFSDTVTCRRDLHANPELSFQETRTCAAVRSQLDKWGIPCSVAAETGLVALLRGSKPGNRVVALRADMDALPIHEANEVSYKSLNPGVMHACGHDVHTASLLTTIRILLGLKEHFGGIVKFIFQPGEEKHPGGASLMIRDGALENPPPDVIIGQHVMPLMPAGTAGFREGKYMASSDEIRLTVIGKGGHASTPDLNIDPVAVAAQIIVALQQVISRQASPKQATVLSFGKVVADGATNVVPDKVFIAGTFRALDEQWRERGLENIRNMATGIAAGMGARCEVEISRGYPCLNNDPDVTRRIRAAAVEYLGIDKVQDIDLTLGSEDFAWYSQKLPASFYRIGTRNESRGITSYVHTPTFDIDEDALRTAPGLMAWIALRELSLNI